ncbi:hypothetical protein D3C76_1661040 [compost metagenome]
MGAIERVSLRIDRTLRDDPCDDHLRMPAIGLDLQPHHIGEVLHPWPKPSKAFELTDNGVPPLQGPDRREATCRVVGIAIT